MEPCGAIKKFTKAELEKFKPDKEHYCGRPKGHKGDHKCLYTGCRKRWARSSVGRAHGLQP